MPHLNPPYDEVHVFNKLAERTGNRVERAAIRGRAGVCRSLTELASKFRRLGDGYYYLTATAWPPDVPVIDLGRTWEPMA